MTPDEFRENLLALFAQRVRGYESIHGAVTPRPIRGIPPRPTPERVVAHLKAAVIAAGEGDRLKGNDGK